MLSSDQLRAARALVRWDQARLAREADVSIETIKRLEKLEGHLGATRVSTIDALCRALQKAGVVFDLDAGVGPGVRFKEAQTPK